jgi:hypothetical protein
MSLLQEIEKYGLSDCEFNRGLIKDKWYCVDIKGELWLIGEHSTEYEARQNARLQGHDVIWLVDNKTAKQWFNTLYEEIK